MIKNFTTSRDPELFVKTVERDCTEMISGTVKEADAYEYVANVIQQASACDGNAE